MANITVNVIKVFGTIGERKSNNLELRLVSWNDNPPKYDLRGWYTDSRGIERCTKGMTFGEDELFEVMKIINAIDLADKSDQTFGVIPSGKYETRITLSKYGYGIGLYGGKYLVKGITMSEDEIVKLKEVVAELGSGSDGRVSAPKEEPKIESDPMQTPQDVESTATDSIVKSLTMLPVNDCNYPLNNATISQLEEAISIMESAPNGRHKTRLNRCKAKLSQLQRKDSKIVQLKVATPTTEPIVETVEEVDVADSIEDASTESTDTTPQTITAGKNIIQFPKKDTTQIVKLAPTNEHHEYSEVEAKLNEERKLFRGDRDSEYVIDGILEACKSDQELLDNVMRPEKSYVGALQYFANKARQGYCIKIGDAHMMSADTALKYSIDYFNSEEPKKPESKTDAPKKTRSTTKRGASKKSAPRRGGKH